jgi:hypothetical protein
MKSRPEWKEAEKRDQEKKNPRKTERGREEQP